MTETGGRKAHFRAIGVPWVPIWVVGCADSVSSAAELNATGAQDPDYGDYKGRMVLTFDSCSAFADSMRMKMLPLCGDDDETVSKLLCGIRDMLPDDFGSMPVDEAFACATSVIEGSDADPLIHGARAFVLSQRSMAEHPADFDGTGDEVEQFRRFMERNHGLATQSGEPLQSELLMGTIALMEEPDGKRKKDRGVELQAYLNGVAVQDSIRQMRAALPLYVVAAMMHPIRIDVTGGNTDPETDVDIRFMYDWGGNGEITDGMTCHTVSYEGTKMGIEWKMGQYEERGEGIRVVQTPYNRMPSGIRSFVPHRIEGGLWGDDERRIIAYTDDAESLRADVISKLETFMGLDEIKREFDWMDDEASSMDENTDTMEATLGIMLRLHEKEYGKTAYRVWAERHGMSGLFKPGTPLIPDTRRENIPDFVLSSAVELKSTMIINSLADRTGCLALMRGGAPLTDAVMEGTGDGAEALAVAIDGLRIINALATIVESVTAYIFVKAYGLCGFSADLDGADEDAFYENPFFGFTGNLPANTRIRDAKLPAGMKSVYADANAGWLSDEGMKGLFSAVTGMEGNPSGTGYDEPDDGSGPNGFGEVLDTRSR